MRDLPLHQATAFFGFLNRATVPLLQHRGQDRELFGSGTLFQTRETLILITAGHFIERLTEHGNIAVADDEQIRYVVGRFRTWRSPDSAPYDVGFIDLTAVRRDFDRYSPLGLQHVFRGGDVQQVFVAGFPHEHAYPLTREFLRQPHVFPTRLYTGDPKPEGVETDVDPEHHLLFDFPATGYQYVNGAWAERAVASCQGVSGGPVWGLLPRPDGAVWSPEGAGRLIAIQSSQVKGRFLRATRWRSVHGCLLTWRPELFQP